MNFHAMRGNAGFAPLFDIVNGFLNRCRGDTAPVHPRVSWLGIGTEYIWLRFNIHTNCRAVQRVVFLVMQLESPALSLVVWTLKREVRAFGECLGMYRR